MNYQHIENLLIRFRGQVVNIKTISGGVYEGSISDVTNDYVALKVKGPDREDDQVIVFTTQHRVGSAARDGIRNPCLTAPGNWLT